MLTLGRLSAFEFFTTTYSLSYSPLSRELNINMPPQTCLTQFIIKWLRFRIFRFFSALTPLLKEIPN